MREKGGKPQQRDDEQLELDFCSQIEAFAKATRLMIEESKTQASIEEGNGIKEEDKLFVQVAAACKRAIADSGRSRAEVLDDVNRYLGRIGSAASKRPISIHVFNNYLSAPTKDPMRTSVVHAIAAVTQSFSPYEILIQDLGGRVITNDEVIELQLGKIVELQSSLAKVKAEQRKQKRRKKKDI